jgi:hypothetical protein
MTFKAAVIQNPNKRILDGRFETIITRILLVLLWEMYAQPDTKFQVGIKPGTEYQDDNRTTYTEAPDPGRTILPKSPSVFDGGTLPGQDGKDLVPGNQTVHRQIQRSPQQGRLADRSRGPRKDESVRLRPRDRTDQ